MTNNNNSSKLNATVINIHSPNDEVHTPDLDSHRRPSAHSNASRQTPVKPSPKVEEYRKMIQHIIGKIVKRKRPPTALFHLSEYCRTTQVTDQFDNDDTIDLLIQLRSALLVCHSVGLSAQVLIQSDRTPTASPVSSRSNSPAASPRGNSSRVTEATSSPIPTMIPKHEKKTDFETILHVLNDLVLNDSRFKTSNPKPSRPPFTMQTILIDIALVLVQIRDDSNGLYQIGSVFLPAFEAFSDGTMLGKLLSMYLDNLLPKLMSCKDEPKPQAAAAAAAATATATSAESKKSPRNEAKSPRSKTTNAQNTPTINIQSPEPESNISHLKMSHLTIDTRPFPTDTASPFSPHSPAAHSTHSSIQAQSIDNHRAYALFTPLLFFMIQYLDPYLAAQPNTIQQENLTFTLTRQANSIHNFHKALSYMMSCKPDLYLDILQVISHSTSEVKFRACQILLYYYFVSVGHVIVADPLPVLGTREELEILDQRRVQQEFEENRQNPQNQLNQPHRHQLLNFMAKQQNLNAPVDEDSVDDHHIWYPHIFNQKPSSTTSDSSTSKNPTNGNTFPLVIHDDMNEVFCKECFKSIQGYGLRCFQCKGCVHYYCSSAVVNMQDQGVMFYVKPGGIQKVVTPQFCPIPPQPRFRDMVNRGILGWNMKSNSTQVCLLGHTFHLVNLYTIIICACCGLPLWGISLQGYCCVDCNRFIHPQCLAEAEEKNSFVKTKLSKKSGSHSFEMCAPKEPLLESNLQITQTELSKNLSQFYGDALPLDEESLQYRSFEEVGTILNTLLLQENILHSGIAAGCILITQDSNVPLVFSPVHQNFADTITPERESNSPSTLDEKSSHCPVLAKAISLCTAYLSSGKCRGSTFLSDFYSNQLHSVDECILSKEEYLSHLSAMIKCLKTSFVNDNIAATGSVIQSSAPDRRRSAGDSRGLLQVSPNPFTAWDDEDDEFGEGHIPNEYLDRSTLLSWIITNLNFKSRKAAEILLQHMCNLGLFERFDASPILFSLDMTQQEEKAIQCVFPVPYAIDCSATVESLINSIDACLQDVDLSINECGFLLLVRRCWPDPFMSNYTMERLIYAIVSWTFDEDERLLALHAELTSSSKSSKSRRSKQQTKWAQAALLSRVKGGNNTDRNQQTTVNHNKTAGVSSGASSIYVITRTALRDRYIARWMSRIHDMDKDAYTEILFNAMENIIDNKREDCAVPNWGNSEDIKKHVLQKYEQLIGHILKLKTNGLTFSSLDSLLQKWLDKTYTEFSALGVLDDKEPVDIRNLAKICSSKLPPGKAPRSHSAGDSAHPLDTIISQFDAGDKESIDRGIRWLTLVMHSGTGIPTNSLAHIARLIVAARSPIKIITAFVKIVWFQAVNILNTATPRAAVVDIIGYLNETSLGTLGAFNQDQELSDENLSNVQMFVKYSAALACYAYGCPLETISELDIVPYMGDHVANLSQSKRSTLHSDNTMIQVDEDTPLIHSMLLYLQYDQLNVREDVIKLFYALSRWGYGISNKDDFLKKCMPQLTPSIWELLTPAYDHLSNINLSLLMKLISIDVRYFQACVFKIFEDPNWEIRYQGLDNLFGLFTKMDAAFQTEWLKLLSHLGPVFSYFVGGLWDKEEHVRSKAYALIRTFGTLHLRSAFRCWEAYFLTATDRQRMSLVSLMIQLNALFPDWQVLQWESLLEALEIKTPVDILDEITRSSSTDHGLMKNNGNESNSDNNQNRHHHQQSAESENIKVLMLTLALQMLSNHLSIEPAQIYRLKFILVQQMDFQDCELFNDGGKITIDFGPLKYNPKDPARVAVMISCIRGLKKIMDSFAPLPAETVATLASDSVEQNKVNLTENSSPGVYFIDVVLKMVNSGVDLTKLGHMMLKAWLEIILIVVYKHNILEREYEQSIVSCMKQIIDLLTEEVSEENKLLILEILKCLLRRSDHLTAMVLSKQILALGKLMTKSGIRNSEPVFLKAKQFLKSAFLRFAVAGLFVLMFKNQAVTDSNSNEVDLFFVLRTVIDQDDIIPDEDFRGEIIYLRDQPVRDVLDKLMKQQMERKAFSTVLHNTSRYVETVHTHPYSENILNDYAGFITALIKHTADWRRSDWNINPMFTMSAILLKEHVRHHAVLLPPSQMILKHGIQSCAIQPENVAKLMAAYTAISAIPGIPPDNAFADIIIEELRNNFIMNNRPNKDTLLALLELVLWDTKPGTQDWYLKIEASILGQAVYGRPRTRYFAGKIQPLSHFFVGFIKRASTSQQFTKKDFKVYSCLSQLLVDICATDSKQLPIVLGYLKLGQGLECLRFLNWFILTLLKEKSDLILYNMIGYENTLTDLLVRTLNTVGIDFQQPDLNFSYSIPGEKLLLCFLLLKVYVLIKLRSGSLDHLRLGTKPQILNPVGFWMTIWPALRRLLDTIEPSTLFISGNIGITVWNMFLSLLQFLFTSRSEIVMVNAYEWKELLDNLLQKLDEENRGMSYQENGSTDYMISLDDFRNQVKKVRDMFDVPPIEVPAVTMINQLYLELRDIMRLQVESITVQGNNRALMQAMTQL